jgi:hypothetical protein
MSVFDSFQRFNQFEGEIATQAVERRANGRLVATLFQKRNTFAHAELHLVSRACPTFAERAARLPAPTIPIFIFLLLLVTR